MAAETSFENLVSRYCGSLYQFAFSLSGAESDARNLTQQAFNIWASKGHPLRDRSNPRTWLFAALHREFMAMRRGQEAVSQHEPGGREPELPAIHPAMIDALDPAGVVALLREVDEAFRAPLILFYLEDFSCREIAEILEIPPGAAQSRIYRGMAQLQQLVLGMDTDSGPDETGRKPHG